jgi:hypothetical protein
MRADIHDGPEHTLQAEAGYIDARPYLSDRRNLLQRSAGPYMWVTRCLPGWVGAAAGLRQTAADLLRRRISAAAGQEPTRAPSRGLLNKVTSVKIAAAATPEGLSALQEGGDQSSRRPTQDRLISFVGPLDDGSKGQCRYYLNKDFCIAY